MKKICKIVVSLMLITTMLYSPFTTTESSYATEFDNFIGNIALFPYDFTPANWMSCEGQELQISNNTALFSIMGVTYGGNGTSTFCIPNLKNKAPKNMHYAICIAGQYGADIDSVLGSIELVPNSYIQRDLANSYLPCDGRQIPITEYDALYSLIGTTFGGDGVSNFKLPNLSLYSPINGYTYMIRTVGIYPTDRLSVCEPFMGSVTLLPFKKSFVDALPCDNQTILVTQNTALYSLISTKFGGTANTNFKMPYLNKLVPNSKFQYYVMLQGLYPPRD